MTVLAHRLVTLTTVRVDRVWLAFAVILALLALLGDDQLLPSLLFTLDALLSTAPYMIIAVLSIGYLKATGAEAVIARLLKGVRYA